MNHSAIHPDNMSFKELIRYCEEHKDPWVQAIAKYAYSFSYHVDEEFRDDPDYYFDNINEKIYDLERTAEWAQEEQADAERNAEEWKEKYDALRLEFNERETQETIVHLKARVQCLHDSIIAMNKQKQIDADFHGSVVNEMKKLKKSYDELHEKYHVFSIIAT